MASETPKTGSLSSEFYSAAAGATAGIGLLASITAGYAYGDIFAAAGFAVTALVSLPLARRADKLRKQSPT